MAKACRRCILTSDVKGITIDAQGLCDYCAGRKPEGWIERFGVTDARRAELLADFYAAVEQARGSGASHHCVLALSGGKDSAYLLHHLQDPTKGGYVRTVCYACNPTFQGLVMNLAAERGIPLAISGCHPSSPRTRSTSGRRACSRTTGRPRSSRRTSSTTLAQIARPWIELPS